MASITDNLDRTTPATQARRWEMLVNSRGFGPMVLIAALFCLVVSGIIIAGRYHSGYRLGQYVAEGIHARADFAHFDESRFAAAQQRARELEPRVYRPNPQFTWTQIEEQMRRWPDMVVGRDSAQLPDVLRASLNPEAIALLTQYSTLERRTLYNQRIESFVAALRKLVVIPLEQHDEEIARNTQWRAPSGFSVRLLDPSWQGAPQLGLASVHSTRTIAALAGEVRKAAGENFHESMTPAVAEYILHVAQPTHVLDPNATQEAQKRAAAVVLQREGEVQYKAGVLIKDVGEITEHDLSVLQAEHRAYRSSLSLPVLIRDWAGVIGATLVLTVVLSWYMRRYQPRIVRNYARTMAIGLLLIAMMIVAHLASSGTRPLYIFGVAPAIVTAMTLAIAYEPRFALGVSLVLAVLTTLALNQSLEFVLILIAGCSAACAFTGTVRTRSRLIEIGFASALAMFAVAMFSGVWAMRGAAPFTAVLSDAVYAAVAGLGSGFVVLGILPFIERIFRITTGMTLLELSDASHPLQRKMATETLGTYSHVLQVAALSEAAAEAIGADSLLARVGALYHDIGKTRRPHYFCENQHGDNAHLSLSPSVSFMIILEHLKDGIELARQHNLPTSIFPFIQQHHGTTLVEYFYHEACKQQRPNERIEEESFRYPGPKPKSREIAIVMLADACESASRAMPEATPESIAKLVHSLILKRLLDGQLSDCDLTLRELHIVEKSLVRTLQSIYHLRVAYPDPARMAHVDEVGVVTAAGGGR